MLYLDHCLYRSNSR